MLDNLLDSGQLSIDALGRIFDPRDGAPRPQPELGQWDEPMPEPGGK